MILLGKLDEMGLTGRVENKMRKMKNGTSITCKGVKRNGVCYHFKSD